VIVGPTPSEPGPILFARYAYPPNALGYCGPSDPDALIGAASPAADLEGLSRLAARFEGAWPYLRLIARCNGIADPLDPRVVEAYWIGNELVAQVPGPALMATVDDCFAPKGGAGLTAPVPPMSRVTPQHSFHVFAVYPWLGLLRAGMDGPPLEVLDRCRIRWGRVEAVTGDVVMVRSRRLRVEGSRLLLGGEQVEGARRFIGGTSLAADVRPGDTVSLHWDWVCDRLSPAALHWLRYCTRRNLRAVNALV
jgi:hypothetical protein